MLLGDRQSLHYVDLTGGERTTVQSLGPGVHVLENAPLGHASGKVDQVRSLVETALRKGEPLWSTLEGVLADHGVPRPAVGEDVRAGRAAATAGHASGLRAHRRVRDTLGDPRAGPEGAVRPAAGAGGGRPSLRHTVLRRERGMVCGTVIGGRETGEHMDWDVWARRYEQLEGSSAVRGAVRERAVVPGPGDRSDSGRTWGVRHDGGHLS